MTCNRADLFQIIRSGRQLALHVLSGARAIHSSELITLQVLTVWVRVAEAGVPTLSYVICPDVEHCLRRIGRLRRPALRRILTQNKDLVTGRIAEGRRR